jgi:hypothetical protein
MAAVVWLQTSDGTRVAVGPGGVLIGRGADCDLVVASDEASRHHALVCATEAGAEVISFGRNPTTVDGAEVRTAQVHASADFTVPGLAMRLCIEGAAGGEQRWALARDGTAMFTISGGQLTLGGSASDDLWLPGLAPGAAVVRPAAGGVLVGERLYGPGEKVEVGPYAFTVARAPTSPQTTRLVSGGLPVEAALEFLPSGARLRLKLGAEQNEVYLPERPAALVAALLQPPRGYTPGDYLPDAELLPRIWSTGGDRTALNVLISRTRKRLHAAGMDGRTLIERSPAGGATRFRLAAGAQVGVT